MSGRNPDQPSRKKLEKIAKRLVSKDIQSQTTAQTPDPMFIIDKEVYEEFLSDIADNIDHSSLSALIHKYDLLGLHTTELQSLFPPNASKTRNFIYLRGLHRQYGYHLCYMALRESANDDNNNGELVEKMRKRAIDLNKNPPSELFTDSPFSSDEDIPQGQGESMEQQLNNPQEEEVGEPPKIDLKVPISANTMTSKEELLLDLQPKDYNYKMEPEEPKNKMARPDRLSAQCSLPLYTDHMDTCKCTTCLKRSDSDPGSYTTNPLHKPLHRLRSEDSERKRIDEHSQNHTHPSPHEATPTVKYTSGRVSGDNIDQSSAGYESSVREEAEHERDDGTNVVSGIMDRPHCTDLDTNNNNYDVTDNK